MIAGKNEPRPVIAVVSGAPLVSAALASALGGFAEVLALPGGQSDLTGLLDSIRPAGVVTDDPADADDPLSPPRNCCHAPEISRSLRTASVGWALLRSQSTAFSLSMRTTDGSRRGS